MKYVIYGFIVVWLYYALRTDDSDKSFWTRSNLRIHTDYKTGLQYLSGGLFGSITPRLNAEGKHMKVGE